MFSLPSPSVAPNFSNYRTNLFMDPPVQEAGADMSIDSDNDDEMDLSQARCHRLFP